jgi:hypothetical protein
MKSYKPIDQEDYQKHVIFSLLKEVDSFYELLSFSIFGFVTFGIGGGIGIESYFLSSVRGTVDSVYTTLKNGRINDSWSLLRKYLDSIVINVYTVQYLDDHFSFEKMVVEKINDWIRGIEKLPDVKTMSRYILDSKKLTPLNEHLLADGSVLNIRTRCNDHMHYNFYTYALLNDNEIFLKNRISELDQMYNDLKKVFAMHLAYMFYMSPHYMMSSDYRDAMDVGVMPEEGAEYFVAPFVQEAFSKFIDIPYPKVGSLIKENSEMILE